MAVCLNIRVLFIWHYCYLNEKCNRAHIYFYFKVWRYLNKERGRRGQRRRC
ncbi:hypothetical protein BN135_2184 [Cronobacter muytjensii 530]